jgi:NAD(P)-dependent dehydrogenase (short-subunit alcohol dehydrogenase family)
MERVVVTGSSGGIGTACVEAFQAEGVEVIGVDRQDSSSADDHVILDLGSPDCGKRLLEALGGRPVDGLVNNAALQLNQAAEDATAEDFDRLYEVNLRAPLLLAAALKPTLASRSGFIVNVASVHAVATSKWISIYAATKGGLTAMTRALAIEWGPQIRVNALLPGAIATEMLVEGLARSESTLDDLGERHPMQRIGKPREVADAVLFLARNQFASGTALILDGGATARLSTE